MKNISLNTIFCLALCLLSFNVANAFTPETYTQNSRLAEGRWVKVKVTESGVYAISDADARKMGFGSVADIRVFGYGGAPISEKLSNYIDDVPQVAVYRTGGKLYFYAQGPITWKRNNGGMSFRQEQNYYTNEAFYFITENKDIEDLLVESKASKPSAQLATTNSVIGRTFHETELLSPGESGKYFIGEDFRYTSTQTFKFQLPGIVSNDSVRVLTQFAAAISGGNGAVSFKANGTSIKSSTATDVIPQISSKYQFVNQVSPVKGFRLSSSSLDYQVSFSSNGNTNIARLDHITVNYNRAATPANGQFDFGSLSAVNLNISNYTEGTTHLWKIGSNTIATEITGEANDGSYAVALEPSTNYVLWENDKTFGAPTYAGAVSNQNIHSLPTPDMIILAPAEFAQQAARIAAMHEERDDMLVYVLDPESVYNEFSSGTPDAMAYRKLCKMFYDRGISGEDNKLGYLLLFSDGSFDNRGVSESKSSFEFPKLLTWESERGLNENDSYSCDALYGMLDDDSELMQTTPMRIAVGRICAKTTTEARDVTDKLLKYVTSMQDGAWKTKTMFVADVKNNAVHMQQSDEAIANMVGNGGENAHHVRIYIDAYDQVTTGSGTTYPGAKTDMNNNLQDGTVWWNYVGHANPYHWSESEILSYSDITNMYNRKLPFLYTATCEFTRFDNADGSGGETMMTNSQGGVIGLISATRTVYIANNGPLNSSICKYVFLRDDDGRYMRIGDIYRMGMNDIRDSNKLRYVLFCDPAIRLKVPEKTAVITAINDKPVSEENMPTFAARQTLKFSGKVVNHKGETDTSFNGDITATLYDAETSVETHGYSTPGEDDGTKYVYDEHSNRLAITVEKVVNGEFSFSVTVPSETMSAGSFENYRPARINLYACDYNNFTEAMGSNDKFYIYGYDETVKSDENGPEIKTFGLNSENFTSGGVVNESPLMIACIADPDGINFSTAGLGHKITLTLDETVVYNDLINYYQPMYPDGENASMGQIYYPLSNIPMGTHTLKLKVWDIFNNSSTKEITFTVKPGEKPEIYDLYTNSNPARESAEFYLTHNRPDAVITMTVEVFDLLGKEVWSHTQTGRSDLFTTLPVVWDLCDGGGRRVTRGIYVYRATISCEGSRTATKSKRIAVAAP